jgi:hypothetical protein
MIAQAFAYVKRIATAVAQTATMRIHSGGMSDVITVGEKPTEIQPKPRPVSPRNGQPIPNGRPKGTKNRITVSLKEAIEAACKPGACHPDGLKGWLIERAQGPLGDRQIFAGLVAKVVPAHIHTTGTGAVTINLGWLTGRGVGNDTITVQSERKSLNHKPDYRISNQAEVIEGETVHQVDEKTPPTPHQSAGGEGS